MTPLLGSQHKAASGVRDNESIWKIQASAQICAVWPSGSDSTSLSTELSSHCCVLPLPLHQASLCSQLICAMTNVSTRDVFYTESRNLQWAVSPW